MLKNLNFDLEDELSLVIGKNNCGKTSLLSALEKFIGSQSASNNFTFDDFNSDFQDSLFNAINDGGTSWSALAIKGIELFIYIEYNDSDNLSNIQPLMLDLDPENNIVILKLEYTLTDQKFHQLFDDFSKYNQKYEHTQGYNKEEIFDVFIKAKHRMYFSVIKKAILYDMNTKAPSATEYSVLDSKSLDLNKILCFRCISARRDTVNKEGDSTLSTLSSRYYEKAKTDEDSPTVVAFENTLHATDKELSSVYEELFEGVISKVKKFGGIRENETVVKIISTLSQQQLLRGNTTVVYENNNHQLPESYNGLGYLNLISIIMEIEIYLGDFLRKDDETRRPADINLLFIEEPEAHTHPQLQYVFIKNIKNLLSEGISDEKSNGLIDLQTIITTHSSHIVSECDFDDIKYFKRTSNSSVLSKNLKDLNIQYKDETGPKNNHFKFLKQYLTLNYAEIFFADKVILFEGETESILLPAMLKKIDEEIPLKGDLPMLSQNISLIASGAYSQIFDQFLKFIDTKTLIITDIDAGKEERITDKNGTLRTVIKAHTVEGGNRTTNGALLHYYKSPLSQYSGGNQLDFFTNLPTNQKVLKNNSGTWEADANGELMVVFQTQESGTYYPRSFEDAFIHINRDFISAHKDTCASLQSKEIIDEKDTAGKYVSDAFKLANTCVKSKSSFALDILLNSESSETGTFSNWKIPPYIEEGLLWLRKN